MLKYYNFDIVFAEIPDEVTLAINITNCPNRCVGCHSPHLQQDIGENLTDDELLRLIRTYDYDITCVCFMGGDGEPQTVSSLAQYVKKNFPQLKTAWYSGKANLPNSFQTTDFNYIKLGSYQEKYGPLNKQTTNQRLYSVGIDGTLQDITCKLWKK